ncbi:uncharacterized protein J3R85_002541 [Psidium guajava]|nr:uncharacterized protein J3R85_002541 [Psidium guajava]
MDGGEWKILSHVMGASTCPAFHVGFEDGDVGKREPIDVAMIVLSHPPRSHHPRLALVSLPSPLCDGSLRKRSSARFPLQRKNSIHNRNKPG